MCTKTLLNAKASADARETGVDTITLVAVVPLPSLRPLASRRLCEAWSYVFLRWYSAQDPDSDARLYLRKLMGNQTPAYGDGLRAAVTSMAGMAMEEDDPSTPPVATFPLPSQDGASGASDARSAVPGHADVST